LIKQCYETSSKGLLSKGVSRVLDCAVEEHAVRDVPEVIDYTISLINRVLGKNTSLLFDSSECIGTTHTLYRFRIVLEKGKYIGVRVIVRGKTVVRVLQLKASPFKAGMRGKAYKGFFSFSWLVVGW